MSEDITIYVSEGEDIVINVSEGDTVTVTDNGVDYIINSGGSYSCQYGPVAPVLVKDSAGTLLYTKNSGETATITDCLIKDSAGTTIHSVKAQQPQTITDTLIKDSAGTLLHTVKAQGPVTTIPDVIVKNSENTTIATIKAEAAPTTIADITVTNPITGATYPYPAGKDYTETYKEVEFDFPTGNDDNQDYIITARSEGTYAHEDIDNVATVSYEVNGDAVSLPFAVVATDTLKVTITRTNVALSANVLITT